MATSSEAAATNPTQAPTALPTRRAYHGSCHCQAIRYVAYLTLPPPLLELHPKPFSTIRIYKCNCSTCHKMSYFHVRLIDASADFFLLSPLDPETSLGDYRCFAKEAHWYFCKTCGVRCFTFARGEGEVRQGIVPGATAEGETESSVSYWAPKSGKVDGRETFYFSLNASTLEPGQEGFSLKEWSEKSWIAYLDGREEKEEDRFGEPHEGGTH